MFFKECFALLVACACFAQTPSTENGIQVEVIYDPILPSKIVMWRAPTTHDLSLQTPHTWSPSVGDVGSQISVTESDVPLIPLGSEPGGLRPSANSPEIVQALKLLQSHLQQLQSDFAEGVNSEQREGNNISGEREKWEQWSFKTLGEQLKDLTDAAKQGDIGTIFPETLGEFIETVGSSINALNDAFDIEGQLLDFRTSQDERFLRLQKLSADLVKTRSALRSILAEKRAHKLKPDEDAMKKLCSQPHNTFGYQAIAALCK